MIRRFSVFGLVFSASTMMASLGAVGCSGAVSDKPAETAASAQAITTTSEHGPVKALADALGKVSLRDAQRTEIQKLFAEADARHTTAKEQSKAGRADLMNAVAAQVQQGKIDRTALAPKEQALATTWKTARDADRAAIERLHDLLDPAQRVALVDAIQANKGDGGRREGGWHKHHGGPGGKERFDKLADELKLTEDQKAKIGDALRAERSAKGERPHHDPTKVQALFEAFKSDRFKMDEVAPNTEFHEPMARAIHLAEIAVPMLTPEQRTTLAAKIREKAQKAD
ncbi:hypothetical protein LZC95_42150 [Pendulispora brunnea]|uniref:Lipoprotein n=1 Tax=Pendulispora brunnea TaxID=2905690 RepID=A0ABZ2K2V3_9BACT